MPLPVLGGVSAEERHRLGEGREQAGGEETETLLTGEDGIACSRGPKAASSLDNAAVHAGRLAHRMGGQAHVPITRGCPRKTRRS